jgi:hypothetical protein
VDVTELLQANCADQLIEVRLVLSMCLPCALLNVSAAPSKQTGQQLLCSVAVGY